MADKHEEAARKEALAAKYADIVRKREETLKERLSNAQYDFFKNQEEPGNGYERSAHRSIGIRIKEIGMAFRSCDPKPRQGCHFVLRGQAARISILRSLREKIVQSKRKRNIRFETYIYYSRI